MGIFTKDIKSMEDLFLHQLQDIYSAEQPLTKAIPKMAKGSHDAGLSTAFTKHLKETEGQVARLEQVAQLLEMKPTGKKCEGMEGVIKEGAEALEEEGDDTILDLGIIGAGSRVEHQCGQVEAPNYRLVIDGADPAGERRWIFPRALERSHCRGVRSVHFSVPR